MNQFKFNGEWTTQIKLPLIASLRSPKFFKPDSHLEWIRDKAHSLKNNLVDLKIQDAQNENEYPEDNQLKAIEYLIENEEVIFKELFRVVKEIIYPTYQEYCGEDFEEEDPLNSLDDLKNAIAINEIEIDIIGGAELAWTLFTFECNVDYEHGLSLLFEGSKYLKHSSAYEMSYDDLIPTIGSKSQKEINTIDENGGPKLYYPNSSKKYFKPWQLEQSKYYLLNLLKEEKIEEFKSIVSDPGFEVNIKFPELDHTIIEDVVQKGYLEIGKFLYENGAHVKQLLHQGNPYYENSNRIHFIGSLKENIDELDPNNLTLLDKYLDIANRALRNKNDEKLSLFEVHVQLLLQYGAKINDAVKYSDLLSHWNIEAEVESDSDREGERQGNHKKDGENKDKPGGWFKRLFG